MAGSTSRLRGHPRLALVRLVLALGVSTTHVELAAAQLLDEDGHDLLAIDKVP
jgi:hypothetical protein